MELYIVRHAIAVKRGTPGYPNDDRPLTDEGRAKMMEAAKGLREILPHVDIILTSPLIRAHDTATIVSKELKKSPVEIFEPLVPGTPLNAVVSALAKYRRKQSVMLVGHEPDLSTLASTLIGTTGSVIEFKKGAICRVDIDRLPPPPVGTLVWLLPPKVLRHVSS